MYPNHQENMRAGGSTVQQALTPDAAAVVKHSVVLARRRGHAQVTPLHVASTMLSSSAGLLRSACLRSHSHPLQCKALELCFNVALNRLPASSSSSPILLGGPHHCPPSLSNALVAAFKRAQAHQRRGSAESQQQPLLAVRIELEQLVVSVLDDPSVSRVMREAGFSSTQVKSNVEQHAVGLENPNPNPNSYNPRSEDVASVIDGMVGGERRRSVVVVGECLPSTEGVVKGVMDRVEKGEVPEALRNLRFITLPLCSFMKLGREEVETKIGELRCLLQSCCRVGGGAVLYLGDLSWAAESTRPGEGYYCPLERAIVEIRGLASCRGLFGGESARFWVMGVATYQTYMRCRVGKSSLESALGLRALTIPAAGLGLSLNSNSQSLLKSKRSTGDQLTCCSDCSRRFEKESQSLPNSCSSSHGSMITSTLPSWLQQYKEENKRATTDHDQESLRHLRKKWNSICDSAHKTSEITLHLSSSYDQPPLWIPETQTVEGRLGANPNRNSTSSSDTMGLEYLPRFKEINAENLKILCNALEKKVAWQKNIVPEITSTILQCRSGMMRRKGSSFKILRAREDSWLFFQGGDLEGKEKIARELASLVFGSRSNLVSIELSTFSSSSSSTRSDSTDEMRNKRSRVEASHSYIERFSEAIHENPHRVFLVDDIEQVDSYSRMAIKRAIERGNIRNSCGEEISVSDAIIILSCESFDSRSRACSPPIKQKMENEEEKDDDDKQIGSSVCLDLNLCAVEEDCSFSDVGLLELVDRAFFFKLAEDL